jgi:hypothetical protein
MTGPPFRFDIKLSWVFPVLILIEYSFFFFFKILFTKPLTRERESLKKNLLKNKNFC